MYFKYSCYIICACTCIFCQSFLTPYIFS